MILSNVNIGTGPSSGNGDPLRTAFSIVNDNFAQVAANVAGLSNSVTSVAGRQGDVELTYQDVAGAASQGYVDSAITGIGNADFLPQVSSTYDLGSTEKRWEDLYLDGRVITSTNDSAGGDTPETFTVLSEHKQIQILDTGYHFVPDGIEGQIMYLVPKTGARKDAETRLIFGNVRYWNGSNAEIGSYTLNTGSWAYGAFHDNGEGQPTLTTMIYTEGAWNLSSGPAIDTL